MGESPGQYPAYRLSAQTMLPVVMCPVGCYFFTRFTLFGEA